MLPGLAVDGDIDVGGDLAVFIQLTVHGHLVATDGEDQVAEVVILGDHIVVAEELTLQLTEKRTQGGAARQRNRQTQRQRGDQDSFDLFHGKRSFLEVYSIIIAKIDKKTSPPACKEPGGLQ